MRKKKLKIKRIRTKDKVRFDHFMKYFFMKEKS